jgi:dienelactone hydrolase
MRFLKVHADRLAIRAAAKLLPRIVPEALDPAAVQAILSDPRLFIPPETAPNIELGGDHSFEFDSNVRTCYACNNRVHGKFYPTKGDWRKRPSVILVHGWNAETHYLAVLPNVARDLNKRGFNAAVLELPYHLHRRPPSGEKVTNFISENIPRMIEATNQAIADMNALVHWLKREGSPFVALWGYSLGGWLVGLHLTVSAAQDAAVLMTPVSNLERAVAELEFCHPIRSALEVTPVKLQCLNLGARKLAIEPRRVHLVEARYDQFVPRETYAQLSAAWSLPGWKVVPQGHLSILVSSKITRQTIDWLTTCSEATAS